MSELKLTGRFIKKLPALSGTSKAGKEWSKTDFVIETQDQFPKTVCFTAFGDKQDALNGINVGQSITVKFDVESREYNDKYFHNLNAWSIEKVASDVPAQQQSAPSSVGDAGYTANEIDTLPF